jgi:hypothetical protein
MARMVTYHCVDILGSASLEKEECGKYIGVEEKRKNISGARITYSDG